MAAWRQAHRRREIKGASCHWLPSLWQKDAFYCFFFLSASLHFSFSLNTLLRYYAFTDFFFSIVHSLTYYQRELQQLRQTKGGMFYLSWCVDVRDLIWKDWKALWVTLPNFNYATHPLVSLRVGASFTFAHEDSTLLFLHVHMSCLIVPQPFGTTIRIRFLFNYCVYFARPICVSSLIRLMKKN
jgi:hypothetical protein